MPRQNETVLKPAQMPALEKPVAYRDFNGCTRSAFETLIREIFHIDAMKLYAHPIS
jgi:hypothetical protein